jgi:hypothetical protein
MAKKPHRLFRQALKTFLRTEAGAVDAVTPALQSRLARAVVDSFLPKRDKAGKILPFTLRDGMCDHGAELIEELISADIRRLGDDYLPEIKFRKTHKRQKGWRRVLNTTYNHPEQGRKRYGNFTPTESKEVVRPEMRHQREAISTQMRIQRAIERDCPQPDEPIIKQLMLKYPTPGFIPDDDTP